MTVDDCTLLSLPKFTDERGSLSFLESNRHVPFPIERIYYLYDIPQGALRGAHAHKELHQFMIAISGSFDVVIDDGMAKKTISLSQPHEALYICPMIWRDLDRFSPGAVCMVVASHRFDEADYYRDYEEFRKAKGLK